MKQSTRYVVVAAASLAVLGGAIAASVTQPPPGGCKPDPAAAITATPAGGVWQGSGCYTTNGLLLNKPITLNGGTFNDPGNAGALKPIIRVKDTYGVTVENVSLNGVNPGGFHGQLVGEAGIAVYSSSGITLNHISTSNTYGDGLTLGIQPQHAPSTNVQVNGYTITNSGRQGVTVAYATNSTLSNVDIVSAADTGWDFETDGNAGSGGITLNHPMGKGINMNEILTGPVTVNDAGMSGLVTLQGSAANGQPVTFNGGTVTFPKNSTGITLKGPGVLSFNGATLTRIPTSKPSTGLAWSVTGGGQLTLSHTSVTPPLGTNDSTSKVVIG